MLLIPVIIIYSIINVLFPDFFADKKTIDAAEALTGFNLQKISLLARSLHALFSAIGTGFIVYGLWVGSRIARLFSNGDVSTEASICLFIKLKTMALYWGLYNIPVQIVFCKIFMPKIQPKMLVFVVASQIFFHLLLFIVFKAIASSITRASKLANLQKEQDLTI